MGKKDNPILWSDLGDETLQALVKLWVRQTLRTCVLFFAPIILGIMGGGAWYAERVINSIDKTTENVGELTSSLSGMKENIATNKEEIHWIRERLEK